MFKQHKLALGSEKVNRFKALKFISRLYKGKGLKAFKVHKTLKLFKVY